MGTLSPIHWVIVIVVVLLLFGPKRLAGIGKGLGEGIRSFKNAFSSDTDGKAESEAKELSEKRSS